MVVGKERVLGAGPVFPNRCADEVETALAIDRAGSLASAAGSRTFDAGATVKGRTAPG